MNNSTHPFPLRPPSSLFNRVNKERGRDSLNVWICAAAHHFLTLTEAERDMVIRDYAKQTERTPKGQTK